MKCVYLTYKDHCLFTMRSPVNSLSFVFRTKINESFVRSF